MHQSLLARLTFILLALLALGADPKIEVQDFRPRPMQNLWQLQQLLPYLAVLAAVMGVLIFVLVWYRRRNRMERLRNLSEKRASMDLDTFLGTLEVTPAQKTLLTQLAGENPRIQLNYAKSRRKFDEAAKRFRDERDGGDPDLTTLYSLRIALGFGFSNVQNEFNDTRMLEPGTPLNCRLGRGEQAFTFRTSVLDNHEVCWLAELPEGYEFPAGTKDLLCQVVRGPQHFGFAAPVLSFQQQGRTLVLGHSHRIKQQATKSVGHKAAEAAAQNPAVNLPPSELI